MTSLAAFIPVLAVKEDAIVAVIVFVITIIGWISKLAGSRTQKTPPVANRPRPPVRPRDDKLQREISIFVEDNAGRRNQSAPPRQPAPASRQGAGQQQNLPQAKRRSQAASTTASRKKARPGEQIASRQAPVAENLGNGVKQSLSQHMTERVAQEVQQRLAPRVEDQAASDLGATVTSGTTRPPAPGAARATGVAPAERFAALLRSPAGVQQAIVLNLILSPPPGRTGSHRR